MLSWSVKHIYTYLEKQRNSLNYIGGKKQRKKKTDWQETPKMLFASEWNYRYFYFFSIFDTQPNLKQLAYITLL